MKLVVERLEKLGNVDRMMRGFVSRKLYNCIRVVHDGAIGISHSEFSSGGISEVKSFFVEWVGFSVEDTCECCEGGLLQRS